MKLHGVVCRQRHTQTFVQELSERILGVLQEETVVTERRHGNWHLGQVVEVLQNRALKVHEVKKKKKKKIHVAVALAQCVLLLFGVHAVYQVS